MCALCYVVLYGEQNENGSMLRNLNRYLQIIFDLMIFIKVVKNFERKNILEVAKNIYANTIILKLEIQNINTLHGNNYVH